MVLAGPDRAVEDDADAGLDMVNQAAAVIGQAVDDGSLLWVNHMEVVECAIGVAAAAAVDERFPGRFALGLGLLTFCTLKRFPSPVAGRDCIRRENLGGDLL